MSISIPRTGATQTDIARAYMTPETRAVVPPRILDARIGTGTVAGGLNNSIRFRIDGSGDARRFVPDSKLAVDLMATSAGPKLIKQLEVAAASTDWNAGKTNLKGFVLPRDSQAVAATDLLAWSEPGTAPLAMDRRPMPVKPEKIKALMHETYRDTVDESKAAGAWNQRGWITFMPDTARMMLTSVGAYVPSATDKEDAWLRRSKHMVPYTGGVPVHEAQHSVTPRKGRYEDVRWMEEGIANIFSKTPVFLHRDMEKTGLSVPSYSGHLAQEPVIDLGWTSWKRPEMAKAERAETDKVQKQRYADSQPILRGLLRMAGAGLNSQDGIDKARQLLQGSELNHVAGNLANAIIERNGIDRDATYEPLRQRIIDSIKDPRSLEKIAADFGVKGP